MQIIIKLKYHFTVSSMIVIKRKLDNKVREGVEKLEHLYTSSGKVKWCKSSGKQSDNSSNGIMIQ